MRILLFFLLFIIGYKCSHNEDRAEDVVLEGEQRQTHVGEDEVFRQEVQHLKQLKYRHNINIQDSFHSFLKVRGCCCPAHSENPTLLQEKHHGG